MRVECPRPRRRCPHPLLRLQWSRRLRRRRLLPLVLPLPRLLAALLSLVKAVAHSRGTAAGLTADGVNVQALRQLRDGQLEDLDAFLCNGAGGDSNGVNLRALVSVDTRPFTVQEQQQQHHYQQQHRSADSLSAAAVLGPVPDHQHDESAGPGRGVIGNSSAGHRLACCFAERKRRRSGKTSHLQTFVLLLKRSWRSWIRSPNLLLAKFLQIIVLALLVGCTFFDLQSNQSSITNRLGLVYFVVICQVFAGALNVVLLFADERALFLHEYVGKLYPVWAFYLAKSLVDVPVNAIGSAVFALIVHGMAGLREDTLAGFVLITVLVGAAGQSIGLAVAAASPTRTIGVVLAPLTIAPFILMAPYSVTLSKLSILLRPLQLMSPFWWSFSGLSYAEFRNLRLECDDHERVWIPVFPGSDDGDSNGLIAVCPFSLGEQVLIQYDVPRSPGTIETCMGMLLVICLVFRILAYWILRFAARRAAAPAQHVVPSALHRAQTEHVRRRQAADWLMRSIVG